MPGPPPRKLGPPFLLFFGGVTPPQGGTALSAAGLLQLVRLTCVYLDNQRDSVFLGNVFFVCNDVILAFQLRAGITKTGYFNVLVEFRDSKDELPFSFSCYNHSDTEKNRPQVVRCPVIWMKSRVIANKEQGCIFFYNSPPPWGGGKESKGLRAREENQRRVEKMERQREKKRKISVGNS